MPKMEMNNTKILVTTVDTWSDMVGSNTMSSLVTVFPPENVASLSIRARKSDSKVATRFFHIIERRVIRSILHPSTITGEEYSALNNTCNKDVESEEKLYNRKVYFGRFFLVLVREILWKLGHWRSAELDDFICDFKPDVLFFPIEGYIHFNRINQYIINQFKPQRVVGYMWDDNFTYKQHRFDFLYFIHRYWLRKSVKSLINSCDEVFAINPKLKKELDKEYGISSILLTKPIHNQEVPIEMEAHEPIRMLYSGKLVIGRDKALADIVEAIKIVNNVNQRVVLDVYSGTPLSTKMRKRIDVPGICNLRGFVPQKEVLEKQQKADVLLFVESLTKQDMSARLSFSTKITDYLSAGKCILAVGNEDLAPIDYLKENDAAVVCTRKDEVLTQLLYLTENNETISYYAQMAFECGRKNHNKEMIQSRFYSVIVGTERGGVRISCVLILSELRPLSVRLAA